MNTGEGVRSKDLEDADRMLFDAITPHYARKDVAKSSAVARKLRLTQTLNAIPLSSGARVLEVGCGAGFSASYLKESRLDFVGIDYSEKLIEYARENNKFDNVQFEVANARTYVCDRPFDAIFMIGVLHHFQDMEAILQHLTTLLKTDGWFVANEPQPSNFLIRGARGVRKRVDNTYSEDQAQLSAQELRDVYARAGLDCIVTRPQGFISTPFAEVVMGPQLLSVPVAWTACAFDRLMNATCGGLFGKLAWNVVAAGCKK